MRGARERILARIHAANREREVPEHPGAPPAIALDRHRLAAFTDAFRRAGGEVVLLTDDAAAAGWLATFARDFASVASCADVPAALLPAVPAASADEAALGVSMAVGAAADTGTLLFESTGGLRARLLPPVHLAWIRAADVRTSLAEALDDALTRGTVRGLPPTLSLHSGPSKSADIGRITVTGVHGPGRVVAAVVGAGHGIETEPGRGP